eukprot:487828-Pelagomonas_calceolata.AAC.1
MEIKRETSSTPCLRVERNLLISMSGACKSMCVLDRMCMKLPSKSKLFKGLQSVRSVGYHAHT